jgi:predicted dehydrogenase
VEPPPLRYAGMSERVVIIGARRRRQGIGAFVAREFHAAGAEVCAVVGTTPASAAEASEQLKTFGINAAPYADLDTALREQRPDIVAVCSPFDAHREQLRRLASAGVHCLCEKPLWWEPSVNREAETANLVDGFVRSERYLELLSQWPRTLPTYYELFPVARDEPVQRFEMRMSPISPGTGMVIDSAPHFISMLWALAGPGKIVSTVADFGPDGRTLTLRLEYHHRCGVIRATFQAVTCEQQPRPAWFGINDRIAERRVEMPSYQMRLEAREGGASVPLPDPLALHVRAFLEATRRGAVTERQRLIESVTNLATLHDAALAEASPAEKA